MHLQLCRILMNVNHPSDQVSGFNIHPSFPPTRIMTMGSRNTTCLINILVVCFLNRVMENAVLVYMCCTSQIWEHIHVWIGNGQTHRPYQLTAGIACTHKWDVEMQSGVSSFQENRHMCTTQRFKKRQNFVIYDVNKNPTDATVCRYLFTAKLLYMFRLSQ